MMRENELLPGIERLEQEEFNLDVEEQRSLGAMVEQEVTRVIIKHKLNDSSDEWWYLASRSRWKIILNVVTS